MTELRPLWRYRAAKRGGFTLIEVLIVVVLLAILSSVLVPALTDAASGKLRGSALLLAEDIQYVQAEAMNSNQLLRIRFVNSTRYQVEDPDGGVGGSTLILRHPQLDYPAHNGAFIVDFSDPGPLNGTTISSVRFGGQSWLEFGNYGEPTAGGYLLLKSGRYQVRITVAPITGMVTIGDLEVSP
jgi:prepilin-type N-terminal cleavage/methylation domain-containing protein